MEITIETLVSLFGLLLGGGGGAFFTWRYMRRKAKAEAVTAEIEAAKELRELYATMLEDANKYLDDARSKMDGLRQERDHYQHDRDELRDEVSKLTSLYYELKKNSEEERAKLRVDITSLQSQLKGLSALTCSVQDCKLRQVINYKK